MKRRLCCYLLFAFSNALNAQGVVLNCDQQQGLLFPKQTLSNNNKSFDVVADKSEIINKDTYLLNGNAILLSNKYHLSADTINIQKLNQITKATGRVELQNNTVMLSADKATIQKINEIEHVTLEQVDFQYPDSKINGQANTVISNGTKQVLNVATYTSCPLGSSDWQMLADKIILDTDTNKGVAEHVRVDFLGVPIFYASRHEWVLKGRGSGFLAPSFASYNESGTSQDKGYQIKIPYYFNLAPNRDFLLTLNQLSTRGSLIEGKYRQLIADKGRFEIDAHYLNNDNIDSKKRWYFDSKLDLSLGEKNNLNVTLNRVSDINYFKEIVHNNTSDTALYSSIHLSHQDEEKNLNLTLFSESEQLVNNGTAAHTRAPEISISKGIEGTNNRHLDLSLVSTKFQHQDSSKITGIRTHAQAVFMRSISSAAYVLSPKLTLSSTYYALDEITNQHRNLAQFNFDSKFFLERKAHIFGTALTQTLTPRLAYNYTPKKNQSALPSFDSVDKNTSYESLFSGQKFTGFDRISNANNITFGLESDFIGETTGETYLSLKAAQIRHFDNADMDSNGNLVARRKYSDITLSADLALNNFALNNTLQYDPGANKIDKRSSTLTYLSSPRKLLTLAHHDDNSIKSAELYGAYPITKKVHVFAGINRSITDKITNKETTGIAYESCCWALRLAHFKTHISDNDYDRVIKFELVLKGLTSTSPDLYQRLEEDVPNYIGNLNNL